MCIYSRQNKYTVFNIIYTYGVPFSTVRASVVDFVVLCHLFVLRVGDGLAAANVLHVRTSSWWYLYVMTMLTQ